MELAGSGASTFNLDFCPDGERLANLSDDGMTRGMGRQPRRSAGMGALATQHWRSEWSADITRRVASGGDHT